MTTAASSASPPEAHNRVPAITRCFLVDGIFSTPPFDVGARLEEQEEVVVSRKHSGVDVVTKPKANTVFRRLLGERDGGLWNELGVHHVAAASAQCHMIEFAGLAREARRKLRALPHAKPEDSKVLYVVNCDFSALKAWVDQLGRVLRT